MHEKQCESVPIPCVVHSDNNLSDVGEREIVIYATVWTLGSSVAAVQDGRDPASNPSATQGETIGNLVVPQ
eukprot:995440-Pyramimonas_sp.AAC.1